MTSLRAGKYFLIRSQMNDNLVLENNLCDEGNVKVSTLISDWASDNAHQLWFYNSANKITNKQSHLCLHVHGGRKVVLDRMAETEAGRMVVVEGGFISLRDSSLVLTLVEGSAVEMRPRQEDSLLQRWSINNLTTLYFYIESRTKAGLVVDVRGDDKAEGAKVILYARKQEVADNQLWCEDERGRLRNKLNHFLLHVNKHNEMILSADCGDEKKGWVVEERRGLVEGDSIVSLADSSQVLSQKQAGFLLGGPRVVATARSFTAHLWNLLFLPHQSISINHSGNGKDFLIRNRQSGRTMEIVGEGVGSRLQLVASHLPASQAPLKQQFCKHHFTDSLRSCLRNFAIEATEDGLIVSAFDPYNKMQAWKLQQHKLCNTHDPCLLIQADIQDEKRISVGQDESLMSQQWEICHVPAKIFYIESLACDKVIDVRGNNADAGVEVVLYDRNSPATANQLWYEDEEGLLRSKLNGYVLDTSEGKVRVVPYEPDSVEQHWAIVGDRIENLFDNKMVIDVKAESKFNCASLIKYSFHGGENQRWKFVYVQ